MPARIGIKSTGRLGSSGNTSLHWGSIAGIVMALWTELRRRHVFRVMAVYAAMAWLVVQLGSVVFPALNVPHWAMPLLIGFVALGFPMAVVLAWAFEMTPEGVRRTHPAESEAERTPEQHQNVSRMLNAAFTAVLLAAVGVLAWQLYGTKPIPIPKPASPPAKALAAVPQSKTRPSTSTEKAGTAPSRSIAVLPFENLSSDKSNAYFAAGMREEVLTKLADLGGLKVISSTSSSRFKSHPEDLKKVARQLDVATVLEGSVQKAAAQVLVNVQLIDARTDSHIWAQSYQRKLADVFTMEGEVAEKVAISLKEKLTGSEQQQLASAPTTNSEAYSDYLRGRALVRTGTFLNLKEAAAAFNEAITKDPGFASAWARLAMADLNLYFGLDPSPQRLTSAKKALDQAASLNPKSAIVQLAQGDYQYYGLRHYEQALNTYEQVVQREHNNSEALSRIAYIDRRLGRWDDALAHFKQATAHDPSTWNCSLNMPTRTLPRAISRRL